MSGFAYFSISGANANRAEGQTGTTPFTFSVQRSGDLSFPVGIDWWLDLTGTTASLDDFTGPLSGTFAMGNGQVLQTITLTVVGDRLREGNESFRVYIRPFNADGQSGGTDSALGTIRADEPTISIVETSLAPRAEGRFQDTPYTFTIERSSGGDDWDRVSWWISGSGSRAADAWDFEGLWMPYGEVVFAPGEMRKAITILVNGDLEREGNEGFTFNIGDPSTGAVLGRSSLATTIFDDEPVVWLETTANSVRGEGDGGVTRLTFMARRAGDGSVEDSVAWWVWNDPGTPTNGADFSWGTAPWGRVTFAPGEYFKEIVVEIAGDTLAEGDEAFSIHIGDPSPGVLVTTDIAWGRIVNDDSAFSVAPLASVVADGSGRPQQVTFTVARAGIATQPASVGWQITGSGERPADGADFGGTLPSGRVTFAAGETSKVVTVQVTPDAVPEGTEGFAILLSDPSSGISIVNGRAEGAILAEPVTVNLSTPRISLAEGQSGATAMNFAFTLSRPLEAASTFAWSVTGVTADGRDFVGGALPSGRVALEAGATGGSIAVNLAGDVEVEASEQFRLDLSDPTGVLALGTATATGTILPDDTGISVSAITGARAEGHAGSVPFSFLLTRSGRVDREETITWSVVGDGSSRAAANDFEGGILPGGTVTFLAGETRKSIMVRTLGDRVVEPDEGFAVVLSRPAAGTSILAGRAGSTILADDTRVAIAADMAGVHEGLYGATPFTFTVTRTGDVSRAEAVTWTVAGTGAKPARAEDFAGGVLPVGSVQFAAGEASRQFAVQMKADATHEGDETFLVRLGTANPGTVFGQRQATATILDDDALVSIAAHSAILLEGAAGGTPFSFLVTRSGPLPAASVDWSVSGDVVGGDFVGGVLPSGRIDFAAGEASRLITVQVAGDSRPEANEAFSVVLSSPSTGTWLANAAANAVILNDDGPVPTLTAGIEAVAAAASEGMAGVTSALFKVRLSHAAEQKTSVGWRVLGGTDGLVAADDLAGGVLPSGRVSFAAGQTEAEVAIQIAGDRAIEPDEILRVELDTPSQGLVIGTRSAETVIRNDDLALTVSVNTGGFGRDAPVTEGRNSPNVVFNLAPTTGFAANGSYVFDWRIVPISATLTEADFAGGVLPSGSVTLGSINGPFGTVGIFVGFAGFGVVADGIAEGYESFTVAVTSRDPQVQVILPTEAYRIWDG
jgi:hypothetical protein